MTHLLNGIVVARPTSAFSAPAQSSTHIIYLYTMLLLESLTGESVRLCGPASPSVSQDSWEMVGKKKSLSGQKEASQADTGEDGKENRDKGGERDVARRRGGAPRRGRGASRGRECESFN